MLYDENDNLIEQNEDYIGAPQYTFTHTENVAYYDINYVILGDNYVDGEWFEISGTLKPQLELGEVAHEWQPYDDKGLQQSSLKIQAVSGEENSGKNLIGPLHKSLTVGPRFGASNIKYQNNGDGSVSVLGGTLGGLEALQLSFNIPYDTNENDLIPSFRDSNHVLSIRTSNGIPLNYVVTKMYYDVTEDIVNPGETRQAFISCDVQYGDFVYYNIDCCINNDIDEEIEIEPFTYYIQLEEGNEMTYWEPSIN